MQLVGVPPPQRAASPPAAPPLAVTRDYRPYYAPLEVEHLVHLHASTRSADPANPDERVVLSDARIHHYRQLACGFIERVANRLGFPRRTIATAQDLYHRFHLHFALNEFAYQDVSLSALLVASKLEDTLKKLREIQIAAWQVTNLLEGGNGMGEGDVAVQEAHRPHLIGIERLILQTICFNFNLHRSLDPVDPTTLLPSAAASASNDALLAAATLAAPPPTRDAFAYLLRLVQALPSLPLPLVREPSPSTTSDATAPPAPSSYHEAVLKSLTFAAFLLLTDLHRTLVPLSYPPHTCAAACVWLAGFVLAAAGAGAEDASAAAGEDDVWDEEMGRNWARTCESETEDIDDISQALLDLLISLCPSPPVSASSSLAPGPSPLFSPASLASPSEPSSQPNGSSSSTAQPKAPSTGLSERDKHLLATGVPNIFSHPALLAAAPNSAAGAAGGLTSVDALTTLKIRVRAARARHPPSSPTAKRAPDDLGPDDTEPELKRAKRWAALDAGLADVGRQRDDKLQRERVRAEERAEREAASAAAGTGGAGEGRTEEDAERERRERRERGKPGSVRYRF
ncbi:hypothetical protein Rhopal_001314-T1 [Rhodotorula paludigena]|uniref:Cyclin-like domain-containing protein n=1 Tax=Rhodotorula paludigena TaxID=86838 RepID=A0AAV5GEN0_9BASI|nr:hypothetical protein Rhopal_001314-T1 [Rhodotorula paludigena]